MTIKLDAMLLKIFLGAVAIVACGGIAALADVPATQPTQPIVHKIADGPFKPTWESLAAGLVIQNPGSFPAEDVVGFKIAFKN